MITRSQVRHVIATAAAVALGAAAQLAHANPLGGEVVGGGASIQGQGTPGVIVNQSSQSTIINWQSFNIAPGETTQFIQPNASSVALNRVTGDKSPSSIFGTLSANGRIFLVNPEGFIFGPSAKINTAAFLATTHDIGNEDFLAGRYNFNIAGNPRASIVNQGTITVADTGIAALVAPGVRNEGIITARLGTVALAAANGFTLDLYGDNLINFALNDEIAAQVIDVTTGKRLKSLAENRGRLSADGGTVAMTSVTARALVDSAINNSGVAEARSVGMQNGQIVLGAQTARSKSTGAAKQKVAVSGTLDTSGTATGETGGKVQVTGEEIALTGATIDASGNAGGGKVLIGGDVGGGAGNAAVGNNPIAALEKDSVVTASSVAVDAETNIDASATAAGDGGKVTVWSDGSTVFDGTIVAHAGAASGNGGFAEVSGHDNLAFNGTVDLAAPKGARGTLLLDPRDVTIGSSGPWIVTVAALQAALASSDVIVNTSAAGADAGDITVAENVSWNNANTLTLSANRDIIVLSGVTIANTSAGNLALRADNTGSGTGTVSFQGTGHVDFSGSTGAVSIFYNPTTTYASPSNYAPFVSGPLTAYMLVNNVDDLQNIQQNLAGNYALGRDIDASGTATWNGGAGFVPLGDGTTPFAGAFEGGEHTIDGLSIDSGATYLYVGLFGYVDTSGTVRNVALTNASISASGNFRGGGVAGRNDGTLSNVVTSGSVMGSGPAPVNGIIIGGIAGLNFGTIADSHSTASIEAGADFSIAGGLVGENEGTATISRSSYSGNVEAVSGNIGGLVGANGGNITQSFSGGSVVTTSNSGFWVGGLVGGNYGGVISQSFSSASVTGKGFFGSEAFGGLIGQNQNNAAIVDSYAIGTVTTTGQARTGGLIGWTAAGSVAQSYAAGPVVTAYFQRGGVVGFNFGGTYADVYWDTQSTGQSGDAIGGANPTNTIPLTTALLQGGLPAGFSAATWGSDPGVNGGYPHLLWQTAVPPAPTVPTILTGGASAPVTLYYVAAPASMIYGQPLPFLSGTVIGFLPGDSLATATTGTLDFTTAATSASNVGDYAIAGSGLTAIGNYVFAQDVSNATALTVTPAALTITADDASKLLGTTLSFAGTEFSSSGLVNSDAVTSVSLSSLGASALATTAGNPYPITPSNAVGTGLSNYTISYVDGALTVTNVPIPPAAQRPPNDPSAIQEVKGLLDADDQLRLVNRTQVATTEELAWLLANNIAAGLSNALKSELSDAIATLIVVALPNNLLNDSYFIYSLQSFMKTRIDKALTRPLTAGATADAVGGIAVSILADSVADALGAWMETKGIGSTSIVLAKYATRLVIEDAYAGITWGAQTGGLSVVAQTASVSVSSVLEQYQGYVQDQQEKQESFGQLGEMIVRVEARAADAAARGDVESAQRLLRRAAEARAYLGSAR